MKPISLMLALVMTGTLAGCANWPGGGDAGRQEYLPEHGGPGYGPEGPASSTNVVPGGPGPASGPSGPTGSSGRLGMTQGSADELGMCELYRRIAAARTQEERQALTDQYLQGMSPEMRAKRLNMMREHCQ